MKKAFTLLELLLTMVIIVVLIVWGFLYFKVYPIEARDSLRYNVLRKEIPNALEVYKSQNWEYPLPSNISPDLVLDWEWRKWLKWTFWEDMLSKIKWLENLPLDPKTNKPYIYLLSEDASSYKLITTLENTKKDYIFVWWVRN